MQCACGPIHTIAETLSKTTLMFSRSLSINSMNSNSENGFDKLAYINTCNYI